MHKSQIKIGCDPELFAFRGDTPVSVHDLLPGNKVFPEKVPRGAIQVDGVAAEFNIQPATNSTEFLRNVRHVSGLMERLLKTKDPTLRLRAVPSVVFDEEYFRKLPMEAKELGCEPDFSAYTLCPNPKPATTRPFRTASGHIHIQFVLPEVPNPLADEHMEECATIVQDLDSVFAGVSKVWDKDEERRLLYGAPGAFRPKPYGCEYRVLSNSWLASDWSVRYVFDVTRSVTERFLMGIDTAGLMDKAKNGANSIRGHIEALSKMGLPDIRLYAPAAVLEGLDG
jgi:hypothetical protein